MNHCVRCVSGLLAAALLAGCGRDNGRIADPPPVLPTFSGIVSIGQATSRIEVQVASNGTFPRDGRFGQDGRFIVPLAALTAPYLVLGSADPLANPDAVPLKLAAVTRANSGTINITPLTQLVVLELARQEPATYFNRLLTAGGIPIAARIADFAPFTDAAITSAQATVVRLLRQELGIVVPASVATGDWATTPFVEVAGDPMYDTLGALSASIARNQFVPGSYPNNRIDELARCAREQIGITVGPEFYPFCPATRDALPDEADASVLVFRLFDIRGNTLSLRLRDSSVIGIELRRSGLPLYSCVEASCSLVMVGGEVSDRSRPLTFSNTVLTAADGSTAQLVGTAIGGVPGRPAINCDGVEGLPLFVAYSDGTATAQCASANVRFEAVASSRYVYRSAVEAFAVPEVRVDGNRLLSITLFQQDEDDLALVPLFECLGEACNGAALGEFVALGNLTNAERTLSLSGTVLQSLSGGTPVTLDGGINLGNRIDRIPPDCTGFPASETVRVRVEGETDHWDLCPPYDIEEGTVTGYLIRDSNIGRFPGAQLGDYAYSFANNQARSESYLTIIASPAGLVRRLQYDRAQGESFACTDAACLSAVSIGPANAQSAHTVSIAPITVPEVLLGDRPGDRRVSLQGQLLTAPDRSFLE